MGTLILYFLTLSMSASELETGLRKNYEAGRWEKFFAYALVYRESVPPHSRKDIQLLEPLALLRHCQTSLVEKAVNNIRKHSPQHESTLQQILALSKTKFKGKATENHSSSPLLAHFEGRQLRKTKPKALNTINPEKMIVRVENLCE